MLRKIADGIGVTAALICAIHCLLLPVAVILFPLFSTILVDDATFHKAMIMFVIPSAFLAFGAGCWNHKDMGVILLGAWGLLFVTFAAFVGHDFPIGERAITVAGGAFLIAGHWRNWALCREKECDHGDE